MTFLEYCKTLAPENWNKKVTKDWTVRDIIAHMVGWEREGVENLKDFLKDGRENFWYQKNDYDYAEFNKESLEYYKNHSNKELLEEWERHEKEIKELMDEIDEEKLRKRKDMHWVFDESEGSHHKHHFNQIKGIIGDD